MWEQLGRAIRTAVAVQYLGCRIDQVGPYADLGSAVLIVEPKGNWLLMWPSMN